MAVTDGFAQSRHILDRRRRRLQAVDHHKIVAQAMHFRKVKRLV
jgi:hypothetical protein